MERGSTYIGGPLTGIDTPVRDFPCETPAEVREMLPENKDVVAFQCRNPVHRAHYELFTRALDAPNVGEDAVVLVHPTCGPTQEDDIPGRDMAGSKSSVDGEDFYGAFEAQDFAKANA